MQGYLFSAPKPVPELAPRQAEQPPKRSVA
jgi:hypothetical protein